MKTVEIDNKVIEIYDNIFQAHERGKFYMRAQDAQYKLDRTSSRHIEYARFVSLASRFNLTDSLGFGFLTSPRFKPFLEIIKNKKLRYTRSYINLCIHDDVYPYHVDSSDVDGLTMLYYLNLEWDPLWEGETHFSDENRREIQFSSSFIPGRLIVFNPTIPHKSSQPSTQAEQFRFTYALKFCSHKDKKSWEKSYKAHTSRWYASVHSQ